MDYVRRGDCRFVPNYMYDAYIYGGVRQRGLDTSPSSAGDDLIWFCSVEGDLVQV